MKTETLTMERPAAGHLHRFSVDDYYRMAEVSILGKDDRVELLEPAAFPDVGIPVAHLHTPHKFDS